MGRDQELKWLAFSLYPLSFFLYSPFSENFIDKGHDFVIYEMSPYERSQFLNREWKYQQNKNITILKRDF